MGIWLPVGLGRDPFELVLELLVHVEVELGEVVVEIDKDLGDLATLVVVVQEVARVRVD